MLASAHTDQHVLLGAHTDQHVLLGAHTDQHVLLGAHTDQHVLLGTDLHCVLDKNLINWQLITAQIAGLALSNTADNRTQITGIPQDAIIRSIN